MAKELSDDDKKTTEGSNYLRVYHHVTVIYEAIMILVVDDFLRDYTVKSREDSEADARMPELIIRLAEGHKEFRLWAQFLLEQHCINDPATGKTKSCSDKLASTRKCRSCKRAKRDKPCVAIVCGCKDRCGRLTGWTVTPLPTPLLSDPNRTPITHHVPFSRSVGKEWRIRRRQQERHITTQ